MTDSYSHESDDHKSRQHDVERGRLATHEAAGLAAPSVMTLYPASFLGERRLGASGSAGVNSRVNSVVMQRAQQTHGNRAVQRYMQRTLPVQRCGDTPCGCSAEEQVKHALDHQPATSHQPVQRQPAHTPAPADPNFTGTTGGDAYVGPGGGAGIQGLVSYGCYCGSGGDAVTGSRCGPGAAPKDDIDAQCMRHDSDYYAAGVDSATTPGKFHMFKDLQGWLKSEEGDRRLADSVDAEMDANPGNYSSSARLYGQGIKGIFGGRANISHAMNWGINKGSEFDAGVTGAYDDASNWGSNKASEAEKGVEGFMKSASGWNSAGDVASGLAGGAGDAANWLGKAGSEAFGGATDALGSAGSWLANTYGAAQMGMTGAALGMGQWGLETAGALGNVGLDLAGRGLSAAGEAVGDVVGGAANKARGAWDSVSSWF